MKEKDAQWDADSEIQALFAEINIDDGSMKLYFGKYSPQKGVHGHLKPLTARSSPG